MWAKQKNRTGFTLIELLIVMVVVAILATLTTIVYTTVRNNTIATNEISDIKTLNRALQSYFAANSAYPSTGGTSTWVGWGQADDFIPSLSPKYIAKQPQQVDDASNPNTSYLYTSNGTDYKLISNRAVGTQPICTAAVAIAPEMADPTRVCYAFGVWSSETSKSW